ncbi:TPA: hypothetical protein RXP51_001664 [Escherichia coli]|nr:hypothetical protein [Escherichia coli]HAO1962620.1 hypothetical protein [Escherichia coli]HAO1967923.1 hypothetical protein [Escherichia coli]HAO2067293.1 hypothetical protein [Escherichia coli]HDX3874041.1 hypothetical protein [Escherichia coli]
MPDIRNAAALYIDTADTFAQLSLNHSDYMRHTVSHFAAERMKHVKQYLEEVLSNYRAGGSVRREYPHHAGMTGKTKATTEGSPMEIKEIKRITNYAMSVAGGQCYQPGGRFLVAFNRRGYFSTKFSRANRFCGCFFTPGRGVNSLGSDISLARFSSSWRSSMRCKSCLRCSAKISVMDWYFLFMLLPCKAMRRSTSHHGADGCYPLGSMPRRFSSVRPNSLSQLARLMPSLFASLSNCSFSSGEIRILNCGDCPSPLGLLSRLIVDKWSPIELAFLLLGGHLNTRALKKAKPRKCHYHSQGF